MKDTFLVCTAVSVVASVVKIILDAASCERVSKVLQIALDLFLLTVLVGAFFGLDFNEYSSIGFEGGDFAAVEDRTLDEIKVQAQKLLEERISDAIKKEFGQKPISCVSVIDIESLELDKLYVYFDVTMLSGYEVKRFLKEKFNVNAEVVFV